jgi:hypothetical protein
MVMNLFRKLELSNDEPQRQTHRLVIPKASVLVDVVRVFASIKIVFPLLKKIIPKHYSF